MTQFKEQPHIKDIQQKIDYYITLSTTMQDRLDLAQYNMERAAATRQSTCQHIYRLSPPSILGYGSQIESRYCVKCHHGLCPSYQNYKLLNVVPTDEEIAELEITYSQISELISCYRHEQQELQRELDEKRQVFRKTCNHEFRWTSGGFHCYGHEDKERYCWKCGLE